MHSTSATERQRQRRGAQGRPETVATTKMIHARKKTPERQRQHIRHGPSTPSPNIDSPSLCGGSSSSLKPPLCGRTRMSTCTRAGAFSYACSRGARAGRDEGHGVHACAGHAPCGRGPRAHGFLSAADPMPSAHAPTGFDHCLHAAPWRTLRRSPSRCSARAKQQDTARGRSAPGPATVVGIVLPGRPLALRHASPSDGAPK